MNRPFAARVLLDSAVGFPYIVSWAASRRTRAACNPPIPKELLMRILACTILAIGTILAAASARAQTYDPNYPVCLQTYDIDGSTIRCLFTSMEQCALSASGGAAQCIINPFFANARAPDRARRR